jgi:RNA polymerase sigma factor (sigma-70 family)
MRALVASFATSTFGRYRRELHRYLMKRLRRPQDVDDLAQEVYMRLLTLDDEKTVQKPLAYLYGVASHVLADHMFDMKQRSHIDWDKDVDDWIESPACVLPDDMADRLNLQQQIDSALDKLTPRQRLVLLMHFRDGWSYDDIALKLGCTWETVSRHLVDGKTRLRTIGWQR